MASVCPSPTVVLCTGCCRRTGALAIWLAMLLVAFGTMAELTSVIGKDQLRVQFLEAVIRRAA